MILGVPYIYLGYPYTKGYRKEGEQWLHLTDAEEMAQWNQRICPGLHCLPRTPHHLENPRKEWMCPQVSKPSSAAFIGCLNQPDSECRTQPPMWGISVNNKQTGKNVVREYDDGIIKTTSYLLLPSVFGLIMCLRYGMTLTRAAQCPGHRQITCPGSQADTINHYPCVWKIEKCSRSCEKEHLKVAGSERTQSFPLICQRYTYTQIHIRT